MNQEDLLKEQAAIARRQAIAAQLMQAGQEPIDTTQVAGNYIVPVSPLTAISKIAQQLSGAYIGKKASEREAALKAQRQSELNSMDFSSPDLANQLAKSGFVDEAIKLQLQKAAKSSENRYQPTNMVVMGNDGQLHVRRFGSDPSAPIIQDTANVPNDMQYLNNGQEFVPVPKRVAPINELMTQGIGAIESNNNPYAKNPNSTASGQYQFTDGTRKDAGLVGATPEQESAVMNELNAARLERYKNPDLAILSHNIGITGADQVANGQRGITPEQQAYVDKVRNKMGLSGSSSLKIKMSPDQVVRNDPVAQAAIKKAEAEAVLPAKTQSDLNSSNIETDKKAYQEQQKSIIDSYNKFNDVKIQLSAFDRAKSAINQARPLMGTLADTRISFAKAQKTLTKKDNPALTAVESLKTNIFQPIIGLLRSVDASPSQQQQAKMEEAFGNPGTDPDALIQKIDDMKQMFLDKVAAHNEMAKKGLESGMKFPVNPIVTIDEPKKTNGWSVRRID